MDGHIDPEELEEYALRRLGEHEVARIEAHLLVCGSCRDALTAEEHFARAIRDALAAIAWADTRSAANGDVQMSVTRRSDGRWLALVAGAGREYSSSCSSEEQARDWCERKFAEHFGQ